MPGLPSAGGVRRPGRRSSSPRVWPRGSGCSTSPPATRASSRGSCGRRGGSTRACGAVQVASVDATYTTGTVVDPAGQVELYATATAEALAAGFTGFRVAAEATSLVRTPAQLDAFRAVRAPGGPVHGHPPDVGDVRLRPGRARR
ncbi:MEDS domain-containing protein [Amycolatopsis sp. cmx-4-61]|uniref:MEDS domain-containing protein n=1 Tax=Amycolatopsis sp. cmx-4-61 TaxID=2790937 RepID=UPI00397A96E2